MHFQHDGAIPLSVVYQPLSIMLGFVFRPVDEGSGGDLERIVRSLVAEKSTNLKCV